MSVSNVNFDRKNNPPKYNTTCSHVIKKEDVPIKIHQLRRIFNLINWSLIHIGCDYYAPVNNKKEETVFHFREICDDDIKMEVRDDKVFGSSFSGGIFLNLSSCEIKLLGGDCLFFSIGGTEAKHGFSIMFSNHDKKYTESEKYIASLPKDYQLIMRCSRCGTRMNESHKLPGLYFLADSLYSLSSPFNAPRCPKCDYKSYSDINFAIKTEIYRIKTNRPVKYEALKYIYAKEYSHYEDLICAEKDNT